MQDQSEDKKCFLSEIAAFSFQTFCWKKYAAIKHAAVSCHVAVAATPRLDENKMARVVQTGANCAKSFIYLLCGDPKEFYIDPFKLFLYL